MLLEVENLNKTYYSGFFGQKSVKAVNDVSFTINEGEIFGLIGESGCGKTTLTKMILGLIKPTSGSIFYSGHDITKIRKKDWYHLRKEMQVVFQHPQATFNPRKQLYFSCAEPIRLYHLAKDQTEADIVYELIEKVGLSKDQLKKYPHEISGGQAQRLSIIRALALDPKLLICDEPTSMLDVSVQAQIIDLLLNIHEERNLTMLFISHDLEVIQAVSNRVAVMHQGRIVETGTVEEVFSNPQHEYTKKLLSSRLNIHTNNKL